MTDSLSKFLKERGAGEDALTALRDDKIDCAALLLMDDEAMKRYIPAFGDRLAAVAYCKSQGNSSDEEQTNSVVERLRKKIADRKRKRNKEDKDDNPRKTLKGNTNAVKKDRRLELGWLDYDSITGEYKQVRSQNGGGTRQLRVEKAQGKEQIIEAGKTLFFPKGKSKRGRVENFSFTVQDFRGCDMGDFSVAELYEQTSVKMLRIYICTKRSREELPECSDSEPISINTSERKQEAGDSDDEVQLGKGSDIDTSFGLEDTLPCISLSPTELSHESFGFGETAGSSCSDTFVLTEAPQVAIEEESQRQDESNTSCAQEQCEQPGQFRSAPPLDYHVDSHPASPIPEELQPPDHQKIRIRLHRISIQQEMIAIFKAPEVIQMKIAVTFVDEAGADAAGVSREAYSAFWDSFFQTSADGEDFRVPSLNPEYGLEEWQAIGRILAKGYRDHEVFPLQLAPSFFQAVMFGEETVSAADLCENFLMYLSETDRQAVKSALDGHLSDTDEDVFEELLDREGCHSLPSLEQVRPVVLQLAHKCIIQNSNYALEAMKRVVQESLYTVFPSVDAIKSMYSKLKPTPKKVCDLLQANPQNKDQAQALRFLTQFIRAQDSEGLGRLLRFLTASRIMSVPRILIEFKDVSGFGRRPVAHTCGPVLDLPSTYTSYRDFRNEWQSVLSSGYLSMDIM